MLKRRPCGFDVHFGNDPPLAQFGIKVSEFRFWRLCNDCYNMVLLDPNCVFIEAICYKNLTDSMKFKLFWYFEF